MRDKTGRGLWGAVMGGLVGLLLFPVLVPAAGEDIPDFPQAIAVLNQERDKAIACAKVLKAFPPADARQRAALEKEYEDARAEFNAAIVRLRLALAQGNPDQELEGIKRDLRLASSKRDGFCAHTDALLTATDNGEKSPWAIVIPVVVDVVLQVAEWFMRDTVRKDELRASQYREALNNAQWPLFADIPKPESAPPSP
ncbi:hypothetical protein ROR02_04900 [Pararhodospirillum oryzae]|uniref:Uncharacterized protein n=2 Tax=Pararhodospirillum oryzae TaxID=478448 RepID=A0A512H4G5_9PROT|nr:hypothetical protein ROR02_04900 [Pararhodospirillum oryzae]